MPLLVKVRSLLRNLFLSRRVDAELDQEVRSHLGMLIEENTRAGMSPEEAQRAARIELGGIEQVKEQVRDAGIGNRLHFTLQFDQSQLGASIRELERVISQFPVRTA